MLLRHPVLVANKEELLDKAKQARVELGSWFETLLHPLPLSEHPRLGYRVGQLRVCSCQLAVCSAGPET